MRFFAQVLVCAVTAVAVAGCSSHRGAPPRAVSIEDDLTRVKPLTEPDLTDFYRLDATKQAEIRNQILTARMYAADIEYHNYEIQLTREMQEEGFLATAANLGLTTSSTLIPVAQTKSLLSGLATATTGLDKTYNEKTLLSNTMQALQTQMRADRKTQAGVIYAKMHRSGGSVTPIGEYTLPMALSDADVYYQAGTLTSALVGLSKTLATREENADQAKASAGPNAQSVMDVKAISTASVLTNASTPMFTPSRVIIKDSVRRGPFEESLTVTRIREFQRVVCVPEDGKFTEDLRNKLIKHLAARKQAAFPDRLTARDGQLLQTEYRAIRDGAKPTCSS